MRLDISSTLTFCQSFYCLRVSLSLGITSRPCYLNVMSIILMYHFAACACSHLILWLMSTFFQIHFRVGMPKLLSHCCSLWHSSSIFTSPLTLVSYPASLYPLIEYCDPRLNMGPMPENLFMQIMQFLFMHSGVLCTATYGTIKIYEVMRPVLDSHKFTKRPILMN